MENKYFWQLYNAVCINDVVLFIIFFNEVAVLYLFIWVLKSFNCYFQNGSPEYKALYNHRAAQARIQQCNNLSATQDVHDLTPNAMAVRVQRCKQLLRRFPASTHSTILFSDEKLFTVEAAITRQNDCIIAPDVCFSFEGRKIICQ